MALLTKADLQVYMGGLLSICSRQCGRTIKVGKYSYFKDLPQRSAVGCLSLGVQL